VKRAPLVALSTIAGVSAVLALNPDGAATLSATASTGSTVTTAPTTATPTTSATTTAKTASATGAAVSARNYGEVQLKVTVKKGVITAIKAVSMPRNDGRSSWISDQVESTLIEQALTAQSASINGVSGATFTSMAFAQSLQSALDKLGL
jgi:uncharacterized protein with FMN-binding domain